MLRGPELLSKVKEMGSMPKSDVVQACGYVSPRKDGSQRLNYTAFYEALLEAKGMSFGGAGESASRKDSVGRKLSYIAKVHFNGNLLVGKAYTSVLGLKPGDEFDIKLERKGIRLIPKHRSEDMMSNASADDSGDAQDAPEDKSATATVSPASPPSTPAASSSAPPVTSAPAPAPIPVSPTAPMAAPAAPPAPGVPPAPAAPAPVATTPAEQPAPKPAPQPSTMDSWEDSLRKLDQSSRPVRWDT